MGMHSFYFSLKAPVTRSPAVQENWGAPHLISLRRAPVGFADGTAAAPITGAPAAYCFYIHTREPRGIRGLVPRNIIGTSGVSTESIMRVRKRRLWRRSEWLVNASSKRDLELFSDRKSTRLNS